jgi:hypothetical protein
MNVAQKMLDKEIPILVSNISNRGDEKRGAFWKKSILILLSSVRRLLRPGTSGYTERPLRSYSTS